jgi:hypothetical protein
MATGGTSVFVIADPLQLQKGVCTRCGGWRPGWGAGWNGAACVKTQHCGGEVRCDICGRCHGTGIEPPHFVSEATWWRPWTWLSGHYEDVFGVRQGKPLGFRLEQHR